MDASEISKGMGVEIVSSGFKGRVESLPDGRGNLTVQCGIIKYRTNISDLIPADVGDDEKKDRTPMKNLSHASTISSELNIIGCTVDEGLARMADYLDDAYVSHLSEVRIVHGKGTGKLRSAVCDQLKKIRYVSDFRSGEYGEGDAGVTIVKFK